MNISGIRNSGFAPQQSLFEPRSAQKQDIPAPQSTSPSGSEGTSGKVGQAGKSDAEQKRIQQQVQQLKAQEEKIKAHEAAHKAAGGQYASSATYSYRPGPDGRSYIVAGEVQIDMSPGSTPQETIAKMQIVQRAALAPGDPSGQDRAVAAQAAAIAAEAQQEQVKQANAEQTSGGEPGSTAELPAQVPKLPKAGPAAISETVANELGAAWSKAVGNGKTEELVAAIQKTQQENDTRQISSYKANTTPGDIFVAQKVSAYA